MDEDVLRNWVEHCYPAQIRAVLNAPQWQQYGVTELAQIGLRGARGFKKGVKRMKDEAKELAHQADLARIRLMAARQTSASAKRELADEFL